MEPSKDDVDRALQLLGIFTGDHIREHAPFRCFVHEAAGLNVDHRDHGTCCLVHDAVDRSKGVLGRFVDDDDRNVCAFGSMSAASSLNRRCVATLRARGR